MSNATDTQSPNYYALPGIGCEAIDVVREVLGPNGFTAFCRGTALVYLLRAGRKDIAPSAQDHVKAANYCLWAAGHDARRVVRLDSGHVSGDASSHVGKPEPPPQCTRCDGAGAVLGRRDGQYRPCPECNGGTP